MNTEVRYNIGQEPSDILSRDNLLGRQLSSFLRLILLLPQRPITANSSTTQSLAIRER